MSFAPTDADRARAAELEIERRQQTLNFQVAADGFLRELDAAIAALEDDLQRKRQMRAAVRVLRIDSSVIAASTIERRAIALAAGK
jgi:hypothetical protein